MAVTVQSVSTVNYKASPASPTKPTGLAEGDLLLAVVMKDPSFATLAAPGGWTQYGGDFGTGNAQTNCFYKIADASDVAASNFSFTITSGEIAVCLYRITAHSATLPIFSITQGSLDSDEGSTITSTFSITPVGADNLVVLVGSIDDNTTTGTNSNYTMTGSPTFTERFDDASATGNDVTQCVADATYASTTEITSASFDTTVTSPTDGRVTLILLTGPQAASGTTALLTQSPTFSAPTASSGTSGTVAALLTAAPTIQIPTATSRDRVWTNETKPSSTWTNETKP